MDMTRDKLILDYGRIIDEQKEIIKNLETELEEYRSIAENIGAQKAISKMKQWENCADNLVDYAHEFVAHLSAWGDGYDRYNKEIKAAEDAIAEWQKLKKQDIKEIWNQVT